MKIPVSIYGTDLCKYILDFDYQNIFTIHCYLQGALPFTNPYSCIIPFDEAIAQEIGCGNWKNRIVVDEVRCNLFNRLKMSKEGILIVDFLSIAKGIFVFQDEFITKYYSPYPQLQQLKHPRLSYKLLRDISPDVVKRLFFSFLIKLTETISPDRIVLIKATFPHYKKMQYGDAIPIEDDEDSSALLQQLYAYWEEFFSNGICPTTIDLSEYCVEKITNDNVDTHRFIDAFYVNAIEQIYSMIFGQSIQNCVQRHNVLNGSNIALIKDEFNDHCPIESLGNNTGNIAFWTSIEKMFNPDQIPHSMLGSDIFDNYDRIILTDLIWIREKVDYSYLLPFVNKYCEKIIVMSVGLQSAVEKQSFELHPSVVELLSKLSEHNPLGLRGKYTEQILKQYGIDNVQIIGCPSMYYWLNPNFSINSIASSKKVVANYRAFYGKTSEPEINLLKLFMECHAQFVEQNKIDYKTSVHIPNIPNLRDYLIKRSELYYSDYGWQKGIADSTFSTGMRFHGNVFALRRGIPALFIYSDTRTKELTDYFSLPAISINTITTETKMNDLVELADYKEFNEKYRRCYDNFLSFIAKCGLSLAVYD